MLLESSLIRRVLERDLDRESRYVELVPKSQFEDPFVREAMRALLRAAIRKGGPRPLYADAMARALAIHLVCYHATASPRLPRYRGRLSAHRLRRVYDFVRAHLDRDLRMGDLAEQASLSEHHFCRMFSAATKETPFQMVRRLRMEEGARLLRVHPDWTVARVALEVGYRDPAAFAKAFRTHLGASPSDYRRRVAL